MKRTLITLIAGLVAVFAQDSYKVDITRSDMTVNGTSTLHDWTSKVETVQSTGNFNISESGISISDLRVKIPVVSIKSGKESMDENTYEALNSEDHPFIEFTLDKIDLTDGSQGDFKITADGKLTVNGQTKPILMNASVKMVGDDMVVTGSYTLKMTDFGVEPPTMFLGTIKTGNEITVKYLLTFVKN